MEPLGKSGGNTTDDHDRTADEVRLPQKPVPPVSPKEPGGQVTGRLD